jgi:tetratricopeptide (TPR) repeat protein
LEQAAKLEPNAPGTQLYLGISYYRLNRYVEAIKALRRAPELDEPKNHLAHYWLGASYRAEKNLASAIPSLQAAKDRAPRDL